MSETPLIEVFKSQAVVMIRNGVPIHELYMALTAACEQVAEEAQEAADRAGAQCYGP